LSRRRAAAVVDVIFDSIAAALKKGEKVTLLIGTFEVVDQPRPPLRRWFLGRVRVTYAQRKVIQFTPAAGLVE
jgi:nucleoid DNA-binding protein